MHITDVLSLIEATAPLSGAASWDKSGVQIAGSVDSVKRLAVTLDPTPHAIQEALDWGADCILTHHPLAMSPRFLDTPGPFLDVARMVLSRGAWLYASHTSLDAQPDGPAGWLARELGLLNLSVLEQTDPNNANVGFGFVGDLPAPLAWDDFARELGNCVPRDFWVTGRTHPEFIQTVSYCTGSGASLLDAASAAGADVHITGDVKYHQALDASLFFVDVGHFSLEEKMIHIFADELSASLSESGISVHFIPGTEPFALHAGN